MDQANTSSPSRAGNLTLLGGMLAFDFANTSSGRGSAQPVLTVDNYLDG